MVLDSILERLGLIRKSRLFATLDFARSVAKRLDEHRETVEAISENTLFLEKFWHVTHLATQDDYLMRLYFLRYGCWPLESDVTSPNGYVRPRPPILGSCRLPEYDNGSTGHKSQQTCTNKRCS